MAERLQKWLAAQGLGSRRYFESLIEQGRITVDGDVAVLGCKVSGREHVRIDGELISVASKRRAHRTIRYHKPVGEICTRSDPQGRRTVFDALPPISQARWISVGRLDVQTSGLLLFTTDGQLAHGLMHPSTGFEREYAVRVNGEASKSVLDELRRGVKLEEGTARFTRVEFAGGEAANRWYRVVVKEGRNRLVRRAWEAVGLRVSRLIRVRYGPVRLPRNQPAGSWQTVDEDVVVELRSLAGA